MGPWTRRSRLRRAIALDNYVRHKFPKPDYSFEDAIIASAPATAYSALVD
jgi:hypothetical protein